MHACRCFAACDNVQCILAVGCCYHRLTEAGREISAAPPQNPREKCPPTASRAGTAVGTSTVEENSSESSHKPGGCCQGNNTENAIGFPMSGHVRSMLPVLGKSALTLAAHSTVDRIAAGQGSDSLYHATFCRAVFKVSPKPYKHVRGGRHHSV